MPVRATSVDQRSTGRPFAADEGLDRAIREIEFALERDDVDFVRTMRHPASAWSAHVGVVVFFLVTTVVLLAAGLATTSWLATVAGTLAFLTAFVVDRAGSAQRQGRPG